MPVEETVVPTKYWHVVEDGRIQCDVCPRYCKLHEGQRGMCFVRMRQDDQVVLTTYGRSSGYCVDPIEKKPLNHFLPGTPILSFGTAGCNLACKFCFHPSTLIATTDGMRRIKDLFDACEDKVAEPDGQIGFPCDVTVWTRTAKLASVSKVFAHPYSGNLLSLEASGCSPLLLTPNHGVFATHRANRANVHLIAAGQLSTDHYLVVPKRQGVTQRRKGAKAQPGFASSRLGAFASTVSTLEIEAGQSTDWLDAGEYFLTPVRHVKHVPYEGTVYNLEVDDPDHSYLAPFLAVSNCQNWDMSKSREMDTLADQASPEAIARAARQLNCSSVAFTYNDPVIFMEYAIDVAQACHEVGVKAVAVTAGYIADEPRRELYRYMDAANVDLKAFTEEFYHKVTASHLQPVLDTLVYLKHETDVWFEITTLLIPDLNDSEREIQEMTQWIVEHLGPDVPLHFTAFHPDYKLTDKPPTPPETLMRARRIALENGVRYAYTGNVHDEAGGSTYCHACGTKLIGRDWYVLTTWQLTNDGRCTECGTRCAGVFDGPPGRWGARRLPVRLASFR